MLNQLAPRVLSMCLLVLLTACAGTVKREPGQVNKTYVTAGVAAVQVSMTPEAQALLKDNPQFNARDLQGYIQRRLEGNGTFNAAAAERVEVVVTSIRVRSTASAVIFGVLAGQDHMEGKVRVLSPEGRRLHSFDVNASYAFGGAAGGDGLRMGWMYEKFSELVLAELTGTTEVSAVDKKNRAKPLPANPSANAAVAKTAVANTTTANATAATAVGVPAAGASESSAAFASTTAPAPAPAKPAARISPELFNLDALPTKTDRVREIYRDWLTQKSPRAVVLAGVEGRNIFATWGVKPLNPDEVTDPTERALQRCLKAGHSNCKLYAVDNEIVWKP
jgi:hypothetical protein